MIRKTIIVAEKIDKFFGDFQALTDINLKIHQGEPVVVCGPSGMVCQFTIAGSVCHHSYQHLREHPCTDHRHDPRGGAVF